MIGNLFKSVINKVVKRSELEKTTEGLKIVDSGKLFKIFFSPSNLLIAYSESLASLIPNADKCIKCFKLYSLQSFDSIDGNKV